MKKSQEQQELFQTLNTVKAKLECMRNYYNEVTDERLISACIYEMNALQAQYSHLISVAKLNGEEGEVNIYPSRYNK